MDSADCWINEFDFKSLTLPTGFVSPGPSSGYCSSEESYNQLKASNGSYDSKNHIFQQGQPESFLNHADVFSGASSLDPANFGGTCGDLIEVENSVFDFGNTPPNFDDLMDTFWNPINADFSSLECIADSDISDTSQSSSGILSSTSNCNDPGLTPFANPTNGAQRYPSGKPGWQKRAASPSKEEPYLVKKPSNPSLSADNAAISAESRNRLKRVFDFQRQVAGLADMMVGDEDEYILQFAPSSSSKVAHRVAESSASFLAAVTATPTAAAAHGSALLGGVFSQRGTVPAPFKNCETRALARVHGGAVSSPCGTLLRHSASMPNSVKSAAAAGNGGAKDGAVAQRSGGSRLQSSGAGQNACTRGDMRGGRANALALALDDHRYTLKPSHSPPVPPRNARGRKSSAAGASTQNAPYPRRMSILEAFLRSTRPLDPNKGSNAALAAEGLAHLRIETDDDNDDGDDDDDDCRSSGTILKKLLTGEIDQSEVHRCEQRVIQERVSNCSAHSASEPVLADDFGLGAALGLLTDSDASNLLCDELASGGLWMNAEIGDETFSSELDEILREQTRQDNLWLRHYIDCL